MKKKSIGDHVLLYLVVAGTMLYMTIQLLFGWLF